MAAIHINPANKGKFTAKAHARGEGVQQAASELVHSKTASTKTKREANFARMAKRRFKPLGRSSRKSSR